MNSFLHHFKGATAFVFLFLAGAIQAQTYDADALRLAQPDLYGTARSLGAGAAFSSVGADPSALAINPAGLGLYRSHEIALSLGYGFGSTANQFLNENTSAGYNKFDLPQASIIFTSGTIRKAKRGVSFENTGSKLERVSFGLGYTRIADFKQITSFAGTNTNNSLAGALARELQPYIQNGRPITLDNASIIDNLAWYNLVVDTLGTGSVYPLYYLPVKQSGKVTTAGSLSSVDLALGFNISDKVYVGVGIGIPILSYNRTFSFTETNPHDSVSFPQNYTLTYQYKMSGAGVNGKFGLIVKPSQWFRLAAAVQTPSYFKITENTVGQLVNNFPTYYYDTTYESYFQYAYYLPTRFTAGGSVYFKQYGFLSVDYQLDDYSHSRFSGDNSFDAVNTVIRAKYRAASSVKVGAEFSWKSLRLRGGFAWMQSPFKSGVAVAGADNSRMNYSAGIGYRGKSFFVDMAYVYSTSTAYFAPYAESKNEPGVITKTRNNLLMATIGFKFGRKP
ncbi:MAG: hypothetical protein U0T84_11255 [Chitinophagales bacterium]